MDFQRYLPTGLVYISSILRKTEFQASVYRPSSYFHLLCVMTMCSLQSTLLTSSLDLGGKKVQKDGLMQKVSSRDHDFLETPQSLLGMATPL